MFFSKPRVHYRLHTFLTLQWVPGTLSSGIKWPGREADHSTQLMPRLGKCGFTHPLPHKPSWRGA
jgi:hypothetical protein